MSCGRNLIGLPSLVCKRCAETLPEPAKFCFACGLPVGGAAGQANVDTGFLRATATLERLMPEQYIKQLLATHGRSVGERRVVTILFFDMEGSTTMAEVLDPEDVMNIMNAAFKVLIEPVFKYEGTLARLMGDAILAFFGAPVAHEDDPVRACRTALEIIDAARNYADHLERERGIRGFDVRVGINTGLVVVGEVGTDLRVEYTAMGDAVNLAARMESSAEPGTILLTDETFKLIEPLFEAVDLGYIDVKGKAEPVHVHRLLETKPEPAPVRDVAGVHSPMVGRDSELAQIEGTVRELRSGRGATIAVTGDPGLGKTRLVHEVHNSCGQDVEWISARCLSHTRNMSFGAAREIFYGLLGVDVYTQPVEVGAALQRHIKESHANDSKIGSTYPLYPYLSRLLDLPLDEAAERELDTINAETLHTRIRNAFCKFVASRAQSGPLVLVWEDLRWIDPSSLELLEALISRTKTQRVLIILVYRLDDTRIRDFHQRVSKEQSDRFQVVTLSALSDRDSTRLLANFLEGRDIPENMERLILDRTEGNAFYLEEVLRSLHETGALDYRPPRAGGNRDDTTFDIPTTLHGVVMSRVDRLDPQHKRTLQTAAVIGRVFQHGVLDGIADPDLKGEPMKRSLEELVQRDFFQIVSQPDSIGTDGSPAARRNGVSDSSTAFHLHSRDAGDQASFLETEYIFKHAMTAEVAYESLLKSQRRDHHKRTGELIETLAPERLDELSTILAHHFRHACEFEKAYRYMARSAMRAASVFANEEAVSCFSNALALAEESGPLADETVALEPAPSSVHESLADVYYVTGRYSAAAAQYDLALVTVGDSPHRVTLLRKKGQVFEKWGKYDEAKAHFEAALDLMRIPLNTAEAAHIYSGLGLASYHEGNLDEAVDLAALALEMMETIENNRGIAQATSNLGVVYFKKQDWNNARVYHERSVGIFEQVGDLFGLAAGYNNLGLVALHEGDWDLACANFDKSLALFEKLGNKHGTARIYDNLSQVYSETGQKDKAIDYMKKAVTILADISAEDTGPSPEMWQSGAW